MPGIAGLISKQSRERSGEELRQMLAAMTAEPFYNSGMWSNPSLGVYAGWVAKKNSFADGMPLENESGDVSLLFSGEDFPDPQLIEDLRSRGHVLGTQQAAYLVHCYEENPHFISRLNGLFHGLIVDAGR